MWTTKTIEAAATALAVELRNQYLVAYHPTNSMGDGKWRNISVRIEGRKELASPARLVEKWLLAFGNLGWPTLTV